MTRRSWRIRTATFGLVALGAAGLVGTGRPAPAHASDPQAAVSTPRRLVPLAGSADVLAYTVVRSAGLSSGYNLPDTSPVHVRTRAGRSRALGPLGTNGRVQVHGWVVDILDIVDTTTVLRWWNLRTGRHGRTTFGEYQRAEGYGLDGWLVTIEAGNRQLYLRAKDGTLTSIGDPLAPDVDYGVITGPTGLVAFSADDDAGNGTLSFVSWRHPHRAQPLDGTSHDGYECTSMNSRFVDCDGGLYPLDGGKTLLPRSPCIGPSTVYGADLAFLTGNSGVSCPARGRLGVLDSHGRQQLSTRRYDDHYTLVSAMGHIVVDSTDQRELLALTTARGRPKRLVTVSG